MDAKTADSIISELSFNEITKLRDQLTKDLKSKRKTDTLSLTVFVPAELRDSFEIAREWAYEKGFTNKPSNYAFARFSVLNVIRMVLDEIGRERNAPPEQPKIPEVPQEPN